MASGQTEAPARVVRFGLFEVDLDASELRRKGVRLKLQEQPLHLLTILLEHPGALVTREELRRQLWKPDTFVDFDHSLNTAMMRLREALGDSSENPRFIETVPRRGYRFIAPVTVPVRVVKTGVIGEELSGTHAPDRALDVVGGSRSQSRGVALAAASELVDAYAAAAAAPARWRDSAVGHPAAPSWRRRFGWVAVAVVMLVVCGAVGYHFRSRIVPGAAESQPIVSIAVLPMENLSGDPNQEYFADGMTDELIASLARITSLRVISHTTAMEYKGTHLPLTRIAHDLNVDAFVEGTVLRSGDRVRITAELVQVSTDRHLWAETYEGPIGDVLALQNQVASAIVSQIRTKLTPEDKQQLVAPAPVNSDAYEDYLKGRYYWAKRSEDALDKAIHYFQAATEKDPQYALAYAGLADCYGILGAAIVGTVPTSQVAPLAENAALKAVSLNPSLAETQTALATVEFNYSWNWPKAEAGFRRAIQLNPSYATAHQRYSLYLMAMGRTEESLAEMNRARTLDPLSLSVNFSLGWRLYMARRYDQAIVQLKNAIDMDPSFVLAHIVLGEAYDQSGQYAQGIAELEKANALSPNSPPVMAALGHIEASSGDRTQALRELDALQAQSARQYVSPYYLALLTNGLGDHAAAIAWLHKAVEDRSNNVVFLAIDPDFDNLHTDPQFQAMLQSLKLTPPR